ncbi:MAG: hypothetical protein MRECE_8c004 [Mycoplasmataceae bacterium CE_OT135]|nr:MAG: hypothetical protein MRECE_8c004 [Mycoplasmataceae bacterium CE_OT135]
MPRRSLGWIWKKNKNPAFQMIINLIFFG